MRSVYARDQVAPGENTELVPATPHNLGSPHHGCPASHTPQAWTVKPHGAGTASCRPGAPRPHRTQCSNPPARGPRRPLIGAKAFTDGVARRSCRAPGPVRVARPVRVSGAGAWSALSGRVSPSGGSSPVTRGLTRRPGCHGRVQRCGCALRFQGGWIWAAGEGLRWSAPFS